MGEEDIELLAFAEIAAPDNRSWETAVVFKGNCKIGCTGRKLLNTKNLVSALRWIDYHRESAEHVGALLKKSGGDITKLPEIKGQFIDNMPQIGGPNE